MYGQRSFDDGNAFRKITTRQGDYVTSEAEGLGICRSKMYGIPGKVCIFGELLLTRESRVRPNFGSGCEPECLHFIGVLSFDDEFREDVGCGGIHEKFRHALAQGIGHDQL